MFGINKNKMKLSGLGLGGLEIEELFEDLTAAKQGYITRHIIGYVEIGFSIKTAIYKSKSDLFLKNN